MGSKQNYFVVRIQRVKTPPQSVAVLQDKEPVVVTETEMKEIMPIEICPCDA